MKIRYCFILLLVGCTTPTHQLRVISVSDQSNNHCIKDNRIICEYKTK